MRNPCLLYTSHADDEVERYGGKLCQRFFTGGYPVSYTHLYLCVCVMKKILLVYDEEVPLCDSWSTVSLFL